MYRKNAVGEKAKVIAPMQESGGNCWTQDSRNVPFIHRIHVLQVFLDEAKNCIDYL